MISSLVVLVLSAFFTYRLARTSSTHHRWSFWAPLGGLALLATYALTEGCAHGLPAEYFTPADAPRHEIPPPPTGEEPSTCQVPPPAELPTTQPESQETLELQPGLRPDASCARPPATYAGLFFRFDASCLYATGGPASCVYLGEVLVGTERWGCGLGVMQTSCGEPWEAKRIECVLWSREFAALLQQVKDEVAP